MISLSLQYSFQSIKYSIIITTNYFIEFYDTLSNISHINIVLEWQDYKMCLELLKIQISDILIANKMNLMNNHYLDYCRFLFVYAYKSIHILSISFLIEFKFNNAFITQINQVICIIINTYNIIISNIIYELFYFTIFITLEFNLIMLYFAYNLNTYVNVPK